MTDNDMSFCTDAEIYAELRKLGYSDISPELFDIMKKDLFALVSSDKSFIDNSPKNPKQSYHSKLKAMSRSLKTLDLNHGIDESYSNGIYSNYEPTCLELKRSQWRKELHSKNFERESAFNEMLNEDLQGSDTIVKKLPFIESPEMHKKSDKNSNFFYSSHTHSPHKDENSDLNEHFDSKEKFRENYDSLPVLEESYMGNTSPRVKTESTHYQHLPIVQQSVLPEDDTSLLSSLNAPSAETSLSKYKNIIKNYKSNNRKRLEKINDQNLDNSVSGIDSSFNSSIVDGKLKRKVLRLKDGKPSITEELVDIPNIFSSSYPDTTYNSSKSHASDLSFKSNSSTGSIVALSPESLTPRSTLSLFTKSRASNPSRKKKNDPVAMYNYYKKFWDNFKPPGEKNHDKLRWAVRDRMLDYSLT